MITKWGKEILNYVLSNGNSAFPSVSTSVGCITAKHSSTGDTIYIPPATYSGSAFNSYINSAISTESAGIAVGSGDTAATENDYTLETQITSGLSGTVTVSNGFDSETNTLYAYATLTLTNSTASDIVVKEIGAFANFGTATEMGGTVSTGGGRRKSVMVDRSVLETPVTVPGEGSAVIRYRINYNVAS